MQLIHTLEALNARLDEARKNGLAIGFVPTMGALHEGHGSLARKSVAENDLTVSSIFVNPTQFGPNEDFDKYPRTLEADCAMLAEMGVDIVFAPSVKEMYPEGVSEVVFGLKNMDKILCGASRPGHFNGVMQVVTKLFNQVLPTRAYFGEKDFQQLSILRRLAQELFFRIEVIGCPIIREVDGLAMSSRNRYLNPEERQQAQFLSNALKMVQENGQEGLPMVDLAAKVTALAMNFPLIRLDYFDIRRSANLGPVEMLSKDENPRALIAAFCGTTRLIDNMPVFKE